MLDYFIKNGLLIDGSGAEPVEAGIGIEGDRIAFIGQGHVPAKEVIDAGGLIISPGFIDTHAHSEFTLLADGRAEGKLSQGITTEINGNCGLSAAPLCGEAGVHREADLRELGIKERWSTFREYFNILNEKGIGVNFATLCGHGNLRASVIGYKDRAPDEAEMSLMKTLLAEALNDGARGLSTGLIYPPGIYSDTEELEGLAKVVHSLRPDGIYASHMRSEGGSLIEAVEEVISIGRGADIPVHISHIKTSGRQNWQKAGRVIELTENARASGIGLTCDRYPYVAAWTDLDAALLPSWAFEGGAEAELRRLKDPDIAGKIKSGLPADEDFYRNIYISSVVKDRNKWMEGESIPDIALKTGRNIIDALFSLLIDEELRVGAIFFSMSEDNLKRFLSLPYIMVGSDASARSFSGITAKGKPHPRAFGTFTRFIGRYVRDGALMKLPDAIRKITSLPAAAFGLKNRGMIKEGCSADIIIFDYSGIIDKATFKEPFIKSEGIEYVFVNGSLSVRDGEFTNRLSGRVLL